MKRFLVLLSVVMCLGFVGTRFDAGAASTCRPTSTDSDADHIADCWEQPNGLTVGNARGNGADQDHDGMTTKTEYALDIAVSAGGSIIGPYFANDDDSDNDGVEDGDEDIDGDALTNENEKEARTNAAKADTDGDGIKDGADDTDRDGLTNRFEAESSDEDGDKVGNVRDMNDGNHDGVDDAGQDFDCDGTKNRNELNAGTADSDRSGGNDFLDDSDLDGVRNDVEAKLGTHPLDPDSDHDGVGDGNEDKNQNGVQDGDEDGSLDDGFGDANQAVCGDGVPFERLSKANSSNYRQKVDFNVVCDVARVTEDDPIVYPGQPGAAHRHVFIGNTTTNASSTQQSLDSGGTNCLLDRDTAAYWIPTLYTNGVEVKPYHLRAYYRAGSLNPVAHIPHGLRIIAGDAHATSQQDKAVAGWQCRQVSPDVQTVPKQSKIPTCAINDLLEGSVVFPNCWDGVNSDSPDHKSHMSYSWADGNPDNCDAAHPVQIPQLTIAARYSPGRTNSSSYLSAMNSGLTLHADFWNSWQQSTLDVLVDRCINAGVHCGDVSPEHFPGALP